MLAWLPFCKLHLSFIDISMFMHRYVNTTAVKSKISFIDGDKGILRYRGYPIEQLAERSNFLEVCFCICPALVHAQQMSWCTVSFA